MPTVQLPYEFPAPMRTSRLVLRPMTDSDVDDVHAYQSLADVCRYLPFEPRTHEQVADKVTTYSNALVLAGDGDFWELAVEMLGNPGHVIGDIYFAIRDLANATCEIGWTVHPEHSGSGYMTEAASAVLDIAFTTVRLHRAVAKIDRRNHTSAALCERLGMRSEAHFVEDLWLKGAWRDTAIYAIIEREWGSRLSRVGRVATIT